MADSVLLFHVSDVHFDSNIYPALTGGAPVGMGHSTTPPPHTALVPNGFFPHDIGACEELENAIKALAIAVKPEQTALVCSGDLTTKGDASEFALALTYLRGRIERYWNGRTGLGPFVPQVFAVPGNHDHWGGTAGSFLGRLLPAANVYGNYFASQAGRAWWWFRPIPCNGISIHVAGIDSCGAWVAQPAAQGAIDPAALQDLAGQYSAAASQALRDQRLALRVLVLHHSPDLGAANLTSYKGLKALDQKSLDMLDDFCRKNTIHVLLTGHAHSHFLPPSGPWQRTVEVRCGTTLQGAPFGRIPGPTGNIFLAHQIDRKGSVLRWCTRLFQRTPGGKFHEIKESRFHMIIP